ncbi:uncharacterized protein BDW43DRAFT_307270 [Aspergillus alliaceus]|uniref:uncharacterized protein n=1 Tax=Petromyces alliaceus TaxID=209559 RepID=UPI0012A43AFB|nr:uncharacterized protein BDW43DRAFT_307270 [Aspergillus alliaceus]KAB8237757.1 hypothetical protein BDW43DRAFT_307270 [Aspergillus alliaceus]
MDQVQGDRARIRIQMVPTWENSSVKFDLVALERAQKVVSSVVGSVVGGSLLDEPESCAAHDSAEMAQMTTRTIMFASFQDVISGNLAGFTSEEDCDRRVEALPQAVLLYDAKLCKRDETKSIE